VKNIHLGVVDQSPIRKGGSAAQALTESVSLAQIAEKLGYERYWVAEHHNSGGYAGTAPEILIGQIASKTTTIKVGSGGVMLSHYSAFKVAEVFRLLDAFYPKRIEIGIGRAPGSDQLTAAALSYPKYPMDIQQFPQQVVDLIGHLSETLDKEHPFINIKVQPGDAPNKIPDVWLLGSSDYSARLAAELGLPFSFADFFGSTAGHGPQIANLYRKMFKPSGYLSKPQLSVALNVMCADTEEKAEYITSSRNISRINSLRGIREPMISPEEATNILLTPSEILHLEQVNSNQILGTKEIVKEKIIDSAQKYETDNINIVSNCYYFEDRIASYTLVAEAFND
jgi:luciferase family oxidoreductase group 1